MNTGSRRILVVDDHADIIFVLRCLLERDGHKVIGAASGKECLDKVREARPDLIILDIMMPNMDGWELCRKLKEDKATSSIPISMLSVLREPKDIKKSLKYAHADIHLTKPIDFKEITDTVQSLLSKGNS